MKKLHLFAYFTTRVIELSGLLLPPVVRGRGEFEIASLTKAYTSDKQLVMDENICAESVNYGTWSAGCIYVYIGTQKCEID